jgi:hypothetical protein
MSLGKYEASVLWIRVQRTDSYSGNLC